MPQHIPAVTTDPDFAAFVERTAREHGIPGAAAGIWVDGLEVHACHGVTSLDNPLAVDANTLFTLGSITKTFTATALVRLAAEGRVDLDAPVRRHVPELRLPDAGAAERITVMNLLNHTAGLDWGVVTDTGEGDDALAGYVARMAGLEQIAEPGSRASYSQAGYNLAGRVIEKVTGMPYERAVARLLLEPLELSDTLFDPADILTRRFSVGHDRAEDGTYTVSRLWKGHRGDNPGGGLSSTLADQLKWARFHLGDGDGLLPAADLHGMRRQTVALRGSSLGQGLGTCWFLRDAGGLDTVGHGGSGMGQFTELLTVPARNFAVVSLSNAGPDGIRFNQAVVRWALEHYLGAVDRDPEPAPHDPARAREFLGRYEIDAMTLDITTDGTALALDCRIRPEIRAAAGTELPPDHAPAALGVLPGDGDEYVVTTGGLAGQRGHFTRDASGTVSGIDLGGRLFNRTMA